MTDLLLGNRQGNGVTDHTLLTSIGTYTHAQIDTFLDSGVIGPVSSVDNTVPRFNGTAGKLIQGSSVVIDDSGNAVFVGTVTQSSFITTAGLNYITRTTGALNGTRPVLSVDLKSAGDVVNGFGPSIKFTLSDTGITEEEIGAIGFQRDGSDTLGKFIVANNSQVTAGSSDIYFAVSSSGVATMSSLSTTTNINYMNRSTGATNSTRQGLVVETVSSGDAADGFGPTIQFNISDTGVTNSEIGAIGFQRYGADGVGRFIISSTSQVTDGSASIYFNILEGGNTGIGTTDLDGDPPIGKLTITPDVGEYGLVIRDATDTSVVCSVDDEGNVEFKGLVQSLQGTDIASANDASAPDSNYCDVTGATQINTMAATGITAGTFVTLQFDSTPKVKHATAGTGAQFQLAGAADFSSSAGDTLTVVYDGTYWREVSRAVI